MVSKIELQLLLIYGNAEFYGALKLGDYAKKIFDLKMRNKLIWHCGEEIRHATMVYSLMERFGISNANDLIPLTFLKPPTFFSRNVESLTEFLIMVHVYELRAPFNYEILMKFSNDEKIKQLSNRLIKEEDSHLSWIREVLQREQKNNKEIIDKTIREFIQFEKEDFERDLKFMANLGNGGEEFVNLIRRDAQKFDKFLEEYFLSNFNLKI